MLLYRNWGDYVKLRDPSANYTNTGIERIWIWIGILKI